jgi:hypothetical protein
MEIASTAMQATISVDILHEPTKITIVRFEMQQHVYNQNPKGPAYLQKKHNRHSASLRSNLRLA